MAYCNTFLRNLRLTAWYKRPYVHLTKLPRCLCPFIDVDYSCLSIATQQNRVLQPQKLRFGRWLSSGAPSVTNFCRIAVLRSQACVPKYRGHRSTFAVLCITELRDQVAVAPRSSDGLILTDWQMSSAEAPPTFDLFQRFVSHMWHCNKTEIKQSRLKQTWNKFVLFQFYFSFISHVRAALSLKLTVSVMYRTLWGKNF